MIPKDSEIGGFTGQELSEAYWWVTHKAEIFKAIVVALIFVNVGFWGYTVYGLTRYFIIDYSAQQRLEAGLAAPSIDYAYWRAKNQPKQLEISSVQSFSLGSGRYDFWAEVQNPNEHWTVSELSYAFNLADGTVVEKTTFVLPGQSKYLLALGVTSSRSSVAGLQIRNIKWRRVQKFAVYQEKALNFTISETKFLSSQELKIKTNLPFSKTSFKVVNNSAFNYWEVGFYVLLKNGPNIVGINYISTRDFFSGASKTLEVSWYQKMSTPDSVMIVPDLDILNPAVFRPVATQYTQ